MFAESFVISAQVSLDSNRASRNGSYPALIAEGQDRIHDDWASGPPADCSYP